jgi:hypothetical protein
VPSEARETRLFCGFINFVTSGKNSSELSPLPVTVSCLTANGSIMPVRVRQTTATLKLIGFNLDQLMIFTSRDLWWLIIRATTKMVAMIKWISSLLFIILA